MWAGCEKNSGNFQSYSNYHNIYYLEDAVDLSFYRNYDIYNEESPEFYENVYWSLVDSDRDQAMFPDKQNFYQWQVKMYLSF